MSYMACGLFAYSGSDTNARAMKYQAVIARHHATMPPALHGSTSKLPPGISDDTRAAHTMNSVMMTFAWLNTPANHGDIIAEIMLSAPTTTIAAAIGTTSRLHKIDIGVICPNITAVTGTDDIHAARETAIDAAVSSRK